MKLENLKFVGRLNFIHSNNVNKFYSIQAPFERKLRKLAYSKTLMFCKSLKHFQNRFQFCFIGLVLPIQMMCGDFKSFGALLKIASHTILDYNLKNIKKHVIEVQFWPIIHH